MIFVFGSNLAGRHGKGAALVAREYYGAEYGVGEGRTGNSYAIPTKDRKLKSLSFDEIQNNIFRFFDYAVANPDLNFNMTPIGTGLAGFSVKDLVLMCNGKFPANVYLHPSWLKEYDNGRG